MPRFRRLFLTLALLSGTFSVFSQCTDWDKLIYYNYTSLNDATRDRFGNLYVVGTFFIDNFTLGSYKFKLPYEGGGAFIAKFDKDYSLVWAISPEANYRASATEIEIDQNENIVVAGYYYTSISFECYNLQGSGRADIFVVSYTKDGHPSWAISSTGVDDSYPVGLTISPNSNIILISNFVEKSDVTPGLMAPDISLGGVPVRTGAVDQVNAGYDSFIAAINFGGTVLWTQGIGGDGNEYDYVQDVTTDAENNVIVTGYFSSPQISFDGKLVHKFTISENYFVAKLNPAGETLWVRETEGGIDQSGWGVETDANDNIFVVGRFVGNAKFGSLNLSGVGHGDVFVVKLDPSGTALNARLIGDTGFDAGTQVEVDSHGRVLVSGYYYSKDLQIGSYSSSKPDLLPSDSFVATLSNDLSTVECAKFITGDAESIIWKMETDKFDNVIIMTDILFGGPTYFDLKTIPGGNYSSVIAILGDNPAVDKDEIQVPVLPVFSLGSDTTLCIGQKLRLKAKQFCNAQYNWSTGSKDAEIEVTQAGTYWVDVVLNGNTVREDIIVSYHKPISIDFHDEQVICPGAVALWTLPVYENATYLWNDGGSSGIKTATMPGMYWVEVSDRCQTVRKTINLKLKSSPVVDLGKDITACKGEGITLRYTPAVGEILLWSDGSTNSALVVTQSGTYTLAVNNGCEEKKDDVHVNMIASGDVVIPNVVTANGDKKNDYFILPDDVENCSLLIYNRWGTRVFDTTKYENNWPQADLSAGIYYYTLHADCIPELRGIIHLMY